MGKILAMILLSTLGQQALAATTLIGTTKNGEECYVKMNLENNNISFQAGRDGFGFVVSADEIKEALSSGQNPVVIEGGDGPISAKLALAFNQDGTLNHVVYKQWTLIIPKKITCTNLQVSQ